MKKLAVFILLACSLAFLSGCPSRQPDIRKGSKVESKSEETRARTAKRSNGTTRAQPQPWSRDTDFKQAIKEAGYPPLITAYKATLPNPIMFERHNIALAAEYVKGSLVKPGELFSLNQALGPRTSARGFKEGPMYMGNAVTHTIGGGVCKIASVMYNVAVQAGVKIVERHPHSMTVPYVPPGQDATVSYGSKDFKFVNNLGTPILIWAKDTGGTLHMAFYGDYKAKPVKWKHNTTGRTKSWTEYTKDPKLAHEGSEGMTVHSWVVTQDMTEGKSTSMDMGISHYDPCPNIVASAR